MDISITLNKAPGQSLGIGFKKMPQPPYCQVYKLVSDGAARQSGKVQEGDMLLCVNGHNVQHLTPDEVRKVLSRCTQDTSILFELRRPYIPSTHNGNSAILSPDDIPNGHLPSNSSPQSPEIPDVATVSPDTSPSLGTRSRRPPVYGGLPGIQETTSPMLNISHLAPQDHQRTQRHSLTPQSRTPEVARRINQMSLKPAKSLDLANLPQWRQHSTPQVPLRNLITETETHDRLHTQGVKYKETGCHDSHCVGSHMWPKEHRVKRPYGMPRSKEEMIPLAEDFIKQYYESKKHALGNSYEDKYQARLNQVRGEIEEKGYYEHTYEEIVFGARMAWRNAPRCVNRIVWRQLEVLDARDANTPKDMFDAICHHIKYANNGGNLRSTITVFSPRMKPNDDFRVWNTQLIRYAAYKQNDGSVLGDPANVEFTEICKRLGWKSPKEQTAFDVLPLVLQAHGGEAQCFTIPPEIVLETTISHPDYDWFEGLGLRWYGLPAVSNVLLDMGGMEYPGAPFSGWYMGTEIGRDLGDVNRYNMLKPIATKMGLNTNSNMKLWKDKAMIELNFAILHSFQKAGISIVDHHSATESFITHMKAETQTRGGCPADWVWIVPPVSGSITPVFHQEMLLYYLTPSYEYQDDPWKHYHWPSAHTARERSGSLTFKRVAMLVRDTARIFRKHYQKRIKATILYATETGRSRNYANVVNNVFGRVFATKVCCMDDYDRANLEQEQVMVIVTSTFGSGDPPANGETFGRYLLDLRNGVVAPPGTKTVPTPRSHRMSTIVAPTRELLEKAADNCNVDHPLTQVKYAVFGLGSRAYPNFCTFAHTCDNLLKDLGAQQIVQCGEGDELCGQEESFQSWLQQCYQSACDTYQLDPQLEEGDWEGYRSGYSKEDYRIQVYEKPQPERGVCNGLRTVHSKGVYSAVIKSRTKLQAPTSDRSTILVVLDKNGEKLDYEPGDHVAIYPQNSSKVVNELIDSLNLSTDPDKPIYVESRRESTGHVRWVQEKRMPVPVTLREAFTYYLDITNPPTPQMLKLLAKQATRTSEQEELNELAKGGDRYEDWKFMRFPSLADVVSQFHSLKLDATLLLQHIPLLQCRYYSISSSPRMHPNEIHATVAIVAFKKRNGVGPWHNGVCSTWLNRIEPGTEVPCFVRKAHAFHLPQDPRTPIIMVGPGTGIAPYRAFWQERAFMRNESLKVQLSQPSSTQQPQVAVPVIQEPQSRRRRMTTITAPKLTLLQTQPNANQLGVGGGMPMRRSLSDTDNTDDIAKMLASKQKAWGNLTLYFGCRRSNIDFIYKEDMKKAQVSGALSEVHVAFSREPNKPKTYVQHLLKENADKIVNELIEERGHFYVCGDISMAADVCRTLQGIFEETAAMSSDQARKLIETMKDKGYYHEDIFGVTLKHQEVTTRVRTAAKKAWRVLVSDNSGLPPTTPITPYPRMPSPSPGSRPKLPFGMSEKNPSYESSSLGRNLRPGGANSPVGPSPIISKRTTVTVLSPSLKTPTSEASRPLGSGRESATEVSNTSPSARSRRKRWQTSVGSPSIDDEMLLSKSNMKLLEDTPQQVSILETLNEASESPLTKEPIRMIQESPVAMNPEPSVSITLTPTQEEKVLKEENHVQSKLPAESPQMEQPTAAAATTMTSPATGESPQLDSAGVTRRTGATAEKKKVRRIKTKSQVETII